MAILKNVGSADRFARIALAILLAALYFTGTITGVAGYVILAIAVVFALTSTLRWCPLYRIFGLNTCSH